MLLIRICCEEILFERNHLLSAILEMKSSFSVRSQQRAMIEFLVMGGEAPISIFQRLEKAYGDAAVDYSAAKKWVCKVKDE